jgi:membrane protease YdiL (CAAX protease family)/predicted esterase
MTRKPDFTPPSTVQVVLLLVRAALRRKLNFLSSGMQVFRRKKAKPGGPRKATPRKGALGCLGMLLFAYMAVVMVFGVSNMTATAFRNATKIVTSPEAVLPDQLSEIKRMATYVASDEEGAQNKDSPPAESWDDVKRIAREEADKVAKTALQFWPSPALAPAPEHLPAFLRMQALILCLMVAAIWVAGLASAKQELGHGGWSMEWLASFPVPVSTLLVTRICEYALADLFLWLGFGPYLLGLFIVLGKGWSALPLAIAFTLLIGIGMAALRVLAETALRKRLTTHALKNLQAMCSLTAMLLGSAAFACLMAPWMMRLVFDWSQKLPASMVWLPPALPAAACAPGQLLPGFGMLALASGVMAGASLWLSSRLLRDGLVANTGTFAGVRGKTLRTASTGPHGVAAKDLRLLLRDRNLLVQTLIIPLTIAGFQAILNPSMARAVLENPNHLAALAFGLGAYMLCFSAIQVLTWEGQGLWLLYTFPEKLERLLTRKVAMWCLIALGYTGAALAVGAWLQASISPALVAGGVLALVGVGLHAFIAAGIGILGADPLAVDIRRRLKPANLLVYMLLASLFAQAIYSPSVYHKVVQLVLSALLAAALWQKVRDHLSYVLDPVSAPPPRISLADGLIAIVAFFALQGIISLILIGTGAPLSQGAVLLIAFSGAGLLVTVTMLLTHRHQRVPDLLAQVGLRRGTDGAGPLAGIGVGLAAGALALAGAWLYLTLVPQVPALRSLVIEQKAAMSAADIGIMWPAVLTILAAPLCEEYIFRGLAFRGLRRMFPPALAIAASAALFAIVHPPLSVIPVFGLGLACAFAFERTKTLLAPVVAHAIYNAVVLLVLSPAFLEKIPDPPPPPPPQVMNDAALPAEAGKEQLNLPGLTKDPFPMLVVLHASGGSPQEALEPISLLVKQWQYAIYAPCGSVRSTQSDKWNREPGYDWNAAHDLDRVAAAVRELMTRFSIHSGAIYLVGRGSGANMAYLLGIRNPDLFAGVIAINGRIQPELLDPKQIAQAAPRLPVMTVHDNQDRSLSPAVRSELLEFFKTHRFRTRMDEHDGSGDDPLTKTYGALDEAITWINVTRAEVMQMPDGGK